MLLFRKFCCKIVTCTGADFHAVGDETCGSLFNYWKDKVVPLQAMNMYDKVGSSLYYF
jgi:hypothetical protein